MVELAVCRADFGDVGVKLAYGVCLELLLRFAVTGHLSQSADTMALQTAMQRRACQARDRGLQGVEAIVQRQQPMLAESDNDGLVLNAQHR
jgi:hypothetical protein